MKRTTPKFGTLLFKNNSKKMYFTNLNKLSKNESKFR